MSRHGKHAKKFEITEESRRESQEKRKTVYTQWLEAARHFAATGYEGSTPPAADEFIRFAETTVDYGREVLAIGLAGTEDDRRHLSDTIYSVSLGLDVAGNAADLTKSPPDNRQEFMCIVLKTSRDRKRAGFIVEFCGAVQVMMSLAQREEAIEPALGQQIGSQIALKIMSYEV